MALLLIALGYVALDALDYRRPLRFVRWRVGDGSASGQSSEQADNWPPTCHSPEGATASQSTVCGSPPLNFQCTAIQYE
jgi:hypothetical protein